MGILEININYWAIICSILLYFINMFSFDFIQMLIFMSGGDESLILIGNILAMLLWILTALSIGYGIFGIIGGCIFGIVMALLIGIGRLINEGLTK